MKTMGEAKGGGESAVAVRTPATATIIAPSDMAANKRAESCARIGSSCQDQDVLGARFQGLASELGKRAGACYSAARQRRLPPAMANRSHHENADHPSDVRSCDCRAVALHGFTSAAAGPTDPQEARSDDQECEHQR